jgi:hypothetical protein
VVARHEDLDGRVVIVMARSRTDGVRACQGAREGSRAAGPTVPSDFSPLAGGDGPEAELLEPCAELLEAAAHA